MYIARKLEGTILRYLNSPEIIAIIGPRQCGKTTLLRHVFSNLSEKKTIFLTFEDKKLLDLFTSNIDDFITKYIKPYDFIFIDEFQHAKKGGKLLKFIIDTVPRKLFISGSSSAELTVRAIKHLVGRIFVFSLTPFDFEEFLSARDKNLCLLYQRKRFGLEALAVSRHLDLLPVEIDQLQQYYQEYLLYGGYPRVVISKTLEEKKLVLKNIYNTYFLREIKDILGLVDDYKFAQMIKALALQIGNLIEYRAVGQNCELSYLTVKRYLNFLAKTFICILIKPYFNNKRTEIVKNPKIYFSDTGLRNYVVDDFRDLDSREDAGALLENAFVMQLLKSEMSFNFWRSKQGAEIDFVVSLPNMKKVAIEIKKRVDAGDSGAKSVREFLVRHKDVPLAFGCFRPNDKIPNAYFLPLI